MKIYTDEWDKMLRKKIHRLAAAETPAVISRNHDGQQVCINNICVHLLQACAT